MLYGQFHTVCGWHCSISLCCVVSSTQFVGEIVRFPYVVWSVPHSLWVTLFSFPMLYGQFHTVWVTLFNFPMLCGQFHTVCGWHCSVFLCCVVSSTQFVGDIVQFPYAVWSVLHSLWVTLFNFPVLCGQFHTVCGWHCSIFLCCVVGATEVVSDALQSTQFVGDSVQFPCAAWSVPHSLWVTL